MLILTGMPRSCTTTMMAYLQMMSGEHIAGLQHSKIDLRLQGRRSYVRGCECTDVNRHCEKFHSGEIKKTEFMKFAEDYWFSTIKYPQFATGGFSEAFESWVEQRPETEVLLMHRNAEEVVDSMERHDMNSIGKGFSESVSILKDRYENFKSTIESLGIPNIELKHDDFLEDPADTIEKLRSLSKLKLIPYQNAIQFYGANGDSPESVWNDWFDKSKVFKK